MNADIFDIAGFIIPYLSQNDIGSLASTCKTIFDGAYVRERNATMTGKISKYNPLHRCYKLLLFRPILSKLHHNLDGIRDLTLIFDTPSVVALHPLPLDLSQSSLRTITIVDIARKRNMSYLFFQTVIWPLQLILLDLSRIHAVCPDILSIVFVSLQRLQSSVRVVHPVPILELL